MTVHQLIGLGLAADPVTNDALALAPHLGPGAEVWAAADGDQGFEESVVVIRDRMAAGSARGSPAAWLVHLAGRDLGPILAATATLPRTTPLLVRFHGLTPVGPLAAVDPRLAAAITASRVGMADLRDRVDAVLATSPATASEAASLWPRADIAIAPPLIPLDALTARRADRTAAGAGAGAVPDRPLVLVPGHWWPQKRVELAVLAHHLVVSHHVPSARLALVGDGHAGYSNALRRLADGLRLGPHRPGRCSPEQWADEIASASVVVIPSVWEGFGTAAVEAMAAGVPVIATDAAGLSATAHRAAILLDRSDGADVWAEAIAAVLEDAGLRAYLRKAGIARAGDLSPRVGAGLAHAWGARLGVL